MKEENNIREKYGTENPFLLPDGYFENLTDKIMNNLPQQYIPETPIITTWQKIRPWLYMAAMFVAILLPIRFMIQYTSSSEDKTTVAIAPEQENNMEEYIDTIIYYSMMDDYTLYQYLTDCDAELL